MSTVMERESAAKNPWEEPKGPFGWMAIISNQELGKLFMVTALVFFMIAGLMAVLMRTQLAVPENRFLGPAAYNRLFTMHGSTMMYLVVVPFVEGLAMYFLPMLIGSRDLAYPYVAAFSYWTYLLGGVMFYASMVLGTVPDVGWFAYTPLSEPGYSGQGTDFWSLALTLVSIGDLAAGSGLTVTVLKLRAPGMSIHRMPLFAWAWLVTGVMIMFAFTTLFTITTLMLPLDRAIGTHFFDPNHGGSTLLWQHLFWFFGHPEVYVMFIPATGVVSSVIPVFARRPMVGYTYVAVAIVTTAFVSFGLWVHHMFATGLPWLSMSFFTGSSLMIAIASGIQVFAWIATLWGSRPTLGVPLLFNLAFLFLFVLGGMTGVMIAIVPFDWQVHDTYFLVAHFHYVLIGGVIFPMLGGMYYWLPKMTGRLLNDRWGHWSFWLTFIGFNVAFFPMHIMGFQGMPRRVYTYPSHLGLSGYNMASSIGAYLLAAGFLLFVLNFLVSLQRGKKAGRDPWGGDTLEWELTSPPPHDNWRVPPIVHSRHPRWSGKPLDRGDPAAERVRNAIVEMPHGWRIALITSVLDGKPMALQPWPRPSYVPFIASVGAALLLLGTLSKVNALTYLGIGITVLSMIFWYRPQDPLLETLRSARLDEKAGLPLVTSGMQSMDWWGLLACLTLISMVYGNFFYSYFYIRLYSPVWPQDHLPRPELVGPGIMFGLLTLSAIPQFLAKRGFDAQKAWQAAAGLAVSLILGMIFLGWHLLSMTGLKFTCQTNAYGSLYFVINWLFSLTVLAALGMNIAAQTRVWREGTNEAGYVSLQVERATLFWYYTVVVGLLVFTILYVSPHLWSVTMEQSIQQKSSEGMLWFGMLGGAIAWVLHLVSIYAISEWGCGSRVLRRLFLGAMGTTWLLAGITLALAALAGAAAWQAHRKEKEARSRSDTSDGEETPHSWTRFAHLARVTSSLFVLIILVESVPTFFFVQSCGVR